MQIYCCIVITAVMISNQNLYYWKNTAVLHAIKVQFWLELFENCSSLSKQTMKKIWLSKTCSNLITERLSNWYIVKECSTYNSKDIQFDDFTEHCLLYGLAYKSECSLFNNLSWWYWVSYLQIFNSIENKTEEFIFYFVKINSNSFGKRAADCLSYAFKGRVNQLNENEKCCVE